MSICKKLTFFGIALGIISLSLVGLVLLGARKVVYELVASQLTGEPYSSSMGNKFPFIMMLILFILILIMIKNIMISILKPLKYLSESTKQISEGNLDYEIKYEKKDEFRQIFEDFDTMRNKLKESVEERERLENARSEMISNISHDIKTPITSINAYIDGLVYGIADTKEKQEQYLSIIKNKANDLDNLINELFLFTKLDSNQMTFTMKKVEFSKYIEGIVEEYSVINQDYDIRFDKNQDNDFFVCIDELNFKRVIQNILQNSKKYKNTDKAKVYISLERVYENIILKIQDNGIGISKNECERIFERFYRTDSARENPRNGSGLGLSIAKFIVNNHGGSIWATGELNKGLTIYISLQQWKGV